MKESNSVLRVKLRSIIGRVPVKNVAENILMMRILAYSAIKMRANPPALYSMLKPETSSDSPSAKSNGVRFVSARVVVNQVRNKGRAIIKGQDFWYEVISCMLNESRVRRTASKINAILTS